jgi:hypothetical protein
MRSRTLHCFALTLFALAVTGLLTAAPVPEKEKVSADDIAKAEKMVKDEMARLKGENGAVMVVKDEPLARAFPRHVFITVFFRQFPVARVLPEGLSASNIFVVGPDSKLVHIKDAKALQGFFKNNLSGLQSDNQLKDVARAWLRLTQEFHQDGFFKFVLMDDSTKVSGDKEKTVAAKVVVMQGGNGEIDATAEFDADGKLTKIGDTAKIRAGPRPICQATKLLDKDPLVRRIAEQDLLIMGLAARDYLHEQRAKASPELQRAIEQLWQRIVEENRAR